MKFLIDNNLSPRLSVVLQELGLDAIHVRELGLQRASDEEIVQAATREGRYIVTADNDFPEMLALSGATGPSVIFLSSEYPTEPQALGILITNQLDSIREELHTGAGVVMSRSRIRIRPLPICGPASVR